MEPLSGLDNPCATTDRKSADVLFLCTGNYYRSRFAEELFNYFAAIQTVSLTATSRGFTPHPHINPGPISVHTLRALESRTIHPVGAGRMPAAVCADDFLNHRVCIALSETEHRPMMSKMFPQFLNRVRFWKVEDLAWETPDSALAKIEFEVKNLLQEIR
ncbi:MAG TPA: low molecular weight phosphatase family protein [Verrucomicrobiae bacterium]|jgi:protein-tyrosine phosphatase|nr:low molecular weight phosphatase family protein [Verrucomicrobiae bacterium]